MKRYFDFGIKNANGPMLWFGFEKRVGIHTPIVVRYYGVSVWRVFLGFVVTDRWA